MKRRPERHARAGLWTRLTLKKPIPSTEGESGLKRVLGPFDLVSLGVGATIGSGIFVLAGLVVARYAGPGVILSFLIAGLVAILVALTYAELASMIPVSGTSYSYAYVAFGELVAWIVGWTLTLVYAAVPAAVAIGWSGYLVDLLKNLGCHLPLVWTNAPGVVQGTAMNLPAFLVSLGVSAATFCGARLSAGLTTFLVFIKLSALVLFIAMASGHVATANWRPFLPFGWNGVVAGAAILFFAYTGFDAISTAAEECRNPQRDLPIGIVGAMITCLVFYTLIAVVLTGILPQRIYPLFATKTASLAFALEYLEQGWAASLLSLGAVVGMTSVMVVLMMSQARVLLAMARDGLLPPVLCRIHRRFCTPHVTTGLGGVVVAFLAGFAPITALAELANFGMLFTFIFVAIGAWTLRHTRPQWKRSFRAPCLPAVATGSVTICLYLMHALPLTIWGQFIVWQLLGLIIYGLYGFRASTLGKQVDGRMEQQG